MAENYDFCGYATKNDIRCSDGRTIRRDAFKECDGMTVPLVWNHQHSGVKNVLGHAVLENREDGVYAYGKFNDSEEGLHAKRAVANGDVRSMSIWANKLKERNGDVLHGYIREVSLVLAGANPGAKIDSVMVHGEEIEDEAIVYSGENETYLEVSHSEIETPEPAELEHKEEEKPEMANEKEETIKEVFDTFTDKQKNVVYAMIGMALDDSEEETEDMKHNVFDTDNEGMETGSYISHDDMMAVIDDFKRSKANSFKEVALAHGIEDLDMLFPDYKSLNTPPEFVKRDTGWVGKVLGDVHHTPFSRIKSMFADITEDEARAKGYITGERKKEETFSLLKRTTDPQTIYKLQKMNRDDVLDITSFDVIMWIKREMRMMLDEELARAILIGDGRLASADDKISEDHVRSVMNDADLFTIRFAVNGSSEDALAKNLIKAAVKARIGYKGSGRPTLYTTEEYLTNMLLLEDTTGRSLYESEAALATKMRVKEIVTVPAMEGVKDKDEKKVYGIIVNLADYNVGADKGGEVSLFDDFDLNYNKMEYLIETRCSGALVKPFSAIVLREGTATASEAPSMKDAMAPFKPQKSSEE